MRTKFQIALLLPLLVWTLCDAAGAQAPPGPVPQGGLAEDAMSYALDYGVDFTEALRRLKLQDAIGKLNARLAVQEHGAFAGLWIEHEPELRVVVQFTHEHGRQTVQRHVGGGPLAGLVESRRANRSVASLEADHAAARFVLDQVGFRADSAIDIRENRVELYTLDPQGLEAALMAASLELPRSVAILQVDALAAPAFLDGGERLEDGSGGYCTSGFVVKNSSGTKGILTAGHCPNSMVWGNSSLSFLGEVCTNGRDVQWHNPYVANPTFQAGSETRWVSGTKSRANQAVGGYVCKQGQTTGYDCGTIQTKSFAPSWPACSPHTSTYIVASAGPTVAMSLGGDSGGPVFSGTVAYGVVTGTINYIDLVYMPIDRIGALGVSVVTGSPPPDPTCEQQCWEDLKDCELTFCGWDPNEYMCEIGCEEDYQRCLEQLC